MPATHISACEARRGETANSASTAQSELAQEIGAAFADLIAGPVAAPSSGEAEVDEAPVEAIEKPEVVEACAPAAGENTAPLDVLTVEATPLLLLGAYEPKCSVPGPTAERAPDGLPRKSERLGASKGSIDAPMPAAEVPAGEAGDAATAAPFAEVVQHVRVMTHLRNGLNTGQSLPQSPSAEKLQVIPASEPVPQFGTAEDDHPLVRLSREAEVEHGRDASFALRSAVLEERNAISKNSPAIAEAAIAQSPIFNGAMQQISDAIEGILRREAGADSGQATPARQAPGNVMRVLDLELAPAELGRVHVRVLKTDDVLRVELAASEAGTVRELRESQAQLEIGLRALSLTVEDLSVTALEPQPHFSGNKPEPVPSENAGMPASAWGDRPDFARDRRRRDAERFSTDPARDDGATRPMESAGRRGIYV